MAMNGRAPFDGVSLVVPAYNEAGNIERAVAAALPLIRVLHARHEMIVVESGSTDGTGEILDALAAHHPELRVIHQGAKLGLGSALIEGFGAARYEQLLYVDGDNPYDITEFRRALPLLAECDIINGFRLSRNDPRLRRLYTALFRFAMRALFNVRLRDANIGFKLMRRSVVQSLSLSSTGFLIDSELLIKAQRHGYRIREFGVAYRARTAGTSTITPRAALRIGLELLQLRWRLWTDARPARRPQPAAAAPRTVIFNADDFGLSPGTNRGIIECCRRGVVKSVSLMVNMPAAEEAVALIRPLLTEVSLGLHLNLVKGRPLTDPSAIPTLVTRDGQFCTLPQFLRRLYTGRINHDELEREVRAQIAWGGARGLTFTHVDSHRHAHLFPAVFAVVQEAAQAFGLRVIRVPVSRCGTGVPELKAFLLQRLARRAGRSLHLPCRPVADTYEELRRLVAGRSLGRFLEAARARDALTVEIGCHPGYPEGAIDGIEARIHDREEELEFLLAARLPEELMTLGWQVGAVPRRNGN